MTPKTLERFRNDYQEARKRLIDALSSSDLQRVAWEAGKLSAICDILLVKLESYATPTL